MHIANNKKHAKTLTEEAWEANLTAHMTVAVTSEWDIVDTS